MLRKKDNFQTIFKNCETCRHIVGDDYRILKSEFCTQGKSFKLVGTSVEYNGKRLSLPNTLDTWKMIDTTGKVSFFKVTRKQMYEKTRFNKVNFEQCNEEIKRYIGRFLYVYT